MSNELEERFQILRVIGSGSYGKVYLARYLDEKLDRKRGLVAVKRIECDSLTVANESMKEILELRYVDHPSVIKHYECFLDQTSEERKEGLMSNRIFCCLVMEYCDMGDLSEVLTENQHIPEEFIVNMITQLSEALCSLHGRNIMHRDISSRNIMIQKGTKGKDDDLIFVEKDDLLSEKYVNFKMVDFGMVRKFEDSLVKSFTVGTFNYMAPEVFNNKGYTSKIDIFSLGCVVLNLMMKEERQVYTYVLQTGFPEIKRILTSERDYSHNLVDLLFKTLRLDPNDRISAVDLSREIRTYNEELRSQKLMKGLSFDVYIIIFSFLDYKTVLRSIYLLSRSFHQQIVTQETVLWKHIYQGKFYHHLPELQYREFLGKHVPKKIPNPLLIKYQNKTISQSSTKERQFGWKENFKKRYEIHKKYIKGNVQKDHSISFSMNILKIRPKNINEMASPSSLSPPSSSSTQSPTSPTAQSFLDQIREKKQVLLQQMGQILFSINCRSIEERRFLIVYSFEIFQHLVNETRKSLPEIILNRDDDVDITSITENIILNGEKNEKERKDDDDEEEEDEIDPIYQQKIKLLGSLYQKMGVIASKLRRNDRAIKLIKQAIFFEPRHVAYRYFLIKFLKNQVSDFDSPNVLQKVTRRIKKWEIKSADDGIDEKEEDLEEVEHFVFIHSTFRLISDQFDILLKLDENNETFLWEYADHLVFYAEKLYLFHEFYLPEEEKKKKPKLIPSEENEGGQADPNGPSQAGPGRASQVVDDPLLEAYKVDYGEIFELIQGCYDRSIELLKQALDLYPEDMSAMRKIEYYLTLKFKVFRKWYHRLPDPVRNKKKKRPSLSSSNASSNEEVTEKEHEMKKKVIGDENDLLKNNFYLTTLDEEVFKYFGMCLKINKYHHEAFMTLVNYLVEKMEFLFYHGGKGREDECFRFCEENIQLLLPHIEKFEYLKESESNKYNRLMNCVAVMTMQQLQCILAKIEILRSLKKSSETIAAGEKIQFWKIEKKKKTELCLLYLNKCTTEKTRLYNIACLYSILSDEMNCKKWFLIGLKKYFNVYPFSYEKMKEDPDLDFLRSIHWFQIIMETLKKKEESKDQDD